MLDHDCMFGEVLEHSGFGYSFVVAVAELAVTVVAPGENLAQGSANYAVGHAAGELHYFFVDGHS